MVILELDLKKLMNMDTRKTRRIKHALFTQRNEFRRIKKAFKKLDDALSFEPQDSKIFDRLFYDIIEHKFEFQWKSRDVIEAFEMCETEVNKETFRMEEFMNSLSKRTVGARKKLKNGLNEPLPEIDWESYALSFENNLNSRKSTSKNSQPKKKPPAQRFKRKISIINKNNIYEKKRTQKIVKYKNRLQSNSNINQRSTSQQLLFGRTLRKRCLNLELCTQINLFVYCEALGTNSKKFIMEKWPT